MAHLAEGAAAVEISGKDDSKALIISDTSVHLRDLEIQSATKYTLSLEAHFEGYAESIEAIPPPPRPRRDSRGSSEGGQAEAEDGDQLEKQDQLIPQHQVS